MSSSNVGAFFASCTSHAMYSAARIAAAAAIVMTLAMSVHNRVRSAKLVKRIDGSSDRAIHSLAAGAKNDFWLEAVELENNLFHLHVFLCGLLMFRVYMLNYTMLLRICSHPLHSSPVNYLVVGVLEHLSHDLGHKLHLCLRLLDNSQLAVPLLVKSFCI